MLVKHFILLNKHDPHANFSFQLLADLHKLYPTRH